MNVFESLIDELKDENLLEQTVLENGSLTAAPSPDAVASNGHSDVEYSDRVEVDDSVRMYEARGPAMKTGNGETVEIIKPTSDQDFFRKRAMDEVSILQMVEHILTGVEREYSKIVPKTFDDFDVKVALNNFLHVSEDVATDGHKQAKFALMQETEAWCSALAARDEKLLVAYLRRFCENARPMLSSRAVLAMAKFYRNLPYSESVRAKYDFLITRLFSRPASDHTRTLLFDPTAMLGHVRTLYADWSSLSLYNPEEDRKNAELARVSFAEFTKEAAAAERFDQLVESDLYNRIRLFKASIAELYFEPSVVVAAIECNVHVGNVYLRLLARERARFEAEFAAAEHVDLDDHAASIATARSLELSDLFAQTTVECAPIAFNASESEAGDDVENASNRAVEKPTFERAPKSSPSRIDSFARTFAGMNRWLLIASMTLIVASVGLWIWSTYFVSDAPRTALTRTFDIANMSVQGELKAGRVRGETFHGVTLPTWDTMPDEKKKEFLQKLYQAGLANGWKSVNLTDGTGKTVGYASIQRLEIAQ